MSAVPQALEECLKSLKSHWYEYLEEGSTSQFMNFTTALNSVAKQFNEHKLPGLTRLCDGLRHQALAISASGHPVHPAVSSAISRQIETILHSVDASHFIQADERRNTAATVPEEPEVAETRPRSIWLIAEESHPWVTGLTEQLAFFGFRVMRFSWNDHLPEDSSPLVALFIPKDRSYGTPEVERIRGIRTQHPASQLFCLAVPSSLDIMVTLLRAGAEVTMPLEQAATGVLAHVLALIEFREQEPYRVLVVEDSPTATAMIQRALAKHGVDSQAISGPEKMLEALPKYGPDLVLMDMHMPNCNGIEATRVLRQIPAYQALPVVYLSSETELDKQIEALRLGGDQFVTKPFTPVFLATVVRTKIERYREMLRSSQHDGLTGLLNHTAAKGKLSQILRTLKPEKDKLCVAMLDIDHFKSVNDLHGHPVGDQVIRNLAWLLKGRLRTSDLIGRYGGEEFLVVLPGASMDDAYAILDRIRQDFSTLPHTHAGATLYASFSGGIAAYPDLLNDNDLIESADNALLEAKGLGRNRIERAWVK